MKIRCIIVDDEPLARRLLQNFVQKTPQLQLVAVCSSATEAESYLLDEAIDLIFLDVQMPGTTGLDWLRTLEKAPLIVLATAFPEYAVEGFELQVTDYLLKPFSYDRFLQAVNKAAYLLDLERKNTQAESKVGRRLLVKADRKLFQVPVEEILYFQAYGDYVKIFRTRNKVLVTKDRLSNLESEIDSNLFLRIHRSYVVSVNAIQFIEGNQVSINDTLIPVSATYREQLLEKLENE
jgi:DNA-binding LytR/AlgR family response regulator